MSARIARGSAASTRRTPARASTRKRRGKAQQPGLLDGLPLSPRALRRLIVWAVVAALLIIGAASALAFKLPQRIGTAVGEQIGAAGFAVTRVELRGLNRLDPKIITKAALAEPSRAMPLIDLDAIRGRLMEFSWVKEARVHRRFPDTLVVEIEERSPAAVWQHNRQLQLIDGEGVALERVRPDALPQNLPLVIGPGAQHRVSGLVALTEAAPQLRPQMAGATWIGGRRWDLRFKTGETVSLPEGDEAAAGALRRFAEMNARRRLLGGNFLRFDMRIDGKMIVQLRNMPEPADPDAAAKPAAPAPDRTQPPQDLSRTI
jgi:cell division protein FtsQ